MLEKYKRKKLQGQLDKVISMQMKILENLVRLDELIEHYKDDVITELEYEKLYEKLNKLEELINEPSKKGWGP